MTADDLLQKARERLAEVDADLARLLAEKVRLRRMLGHNPHPPIVPAMPVLPIEPSLPPWEPPGLPWYPNLPATPWTPRIVPNTAPWWQQCPWGVTICGTTLQFGDAFETAEARAVRLAMS